MEMLWLVAGLGSAAGVVRLGQAWGTRRDRRRFPPRGELTELASGRLHLLRQGAGPAPTVVLEAALGGSSLGWTQVQQELAAYAPTLSYDRAGMGWSEAGPMPRTLSRQVEELRALLAAAAAPAPYVLVGHSYGGWVVGLFAQRYPELVAGLVLVDAPDAEEWISPEAATQTKLVRGITLARRGAWLARWGWARAVAAGLGNGTHAFARFGIAGLSAGHLGRRRQQFAPILLLPAKLQPMLRAAWLQPRFYESLASQLQHLPEAARSFAEAGDFGELPLVVLSAADATPERLRRQATLAARSRRGVHRQATVGGHWIPLEQPGLIVAAVLELLGKGDEGGRNPAAG